MTQSVGRPRNAGVDSALIRAAEELILDKGLSAVSVEAVAARAGTTRPAFYRRFEGVPQLILALLLKRFGTDLDFEIDSGDLRTDLEAVQRDQVTLFGNPLVQRSLAGFLDSLHTNARLRSAFVEQILGPRRAAAVGIIQRAADRGEIPPSPDAEWICDLLTGPLVMRTVMPGLRPLDEALISDTVTSALSALGYRSPLRSSIARADQD